jgi:hypothetical protein
MSHAESVFLYPGQFVLRTGLAHRQLGSADVHLRTLVFRYAQTAWQVQAGGGLLSQCEPPITMVFHIPREGERLKNICFLTGGQEGRGVS